MRPSRYAVVLAALLGATGLTVWAAGLELGPLNAPVALGIAAGKAFLVAAYFMHLRASPRFTWVVAASGLFWLLFLIALSMGDYLTRGGGAE